MKKLLINKIKLNNIAVYKNQEFIFSNNTNIIIGENGYGKSTLYSAIKIGLYGDKSTKKYNRLQEFNKILNKLIRNNTKEAIIELHISLKQTNYIIKRKLEQKEEGIDFQTDILFLDGTLLSKKQLFIFNELYNEIILTSNLDFFFLDGEEINEKLKKESDYQQWINRNIEEYFNIFQYNKLLKLFKVIEQNEWKYSNDNKDINERIKLHDLSNKIDKNEKNLVLEETKRKKIKNSFFLQTKEFELTLSKYDYNIKDYVSEHKILEEEIPYLLIENKIKNVNSKIINNVIDVVKQYLNKDYTNKIFENPVTLLERTNNIIEIISKINIQEIEKNEINLKDNERLDLENMKKNYIKLERELSNVSINIEKINNELQELRNEKIKIDSFIHEEYKKNTILKQNIERYRRDIEEQKNISNKNINKMFEKLNLDIKKFFKNYSIQYKNRKIILFENNNLHNWESISAGEKQVITNMILKAIWNFTDFSSTIYYDTPMGRLDTKNKNLLTKEFFNKINSQVIIFSTDEEFTLERIKKLNNPTVIRLQKDRYKNETEVTYDSTR